MECKPKINANLFDDSMFVLDILNFSIKMQLDTRIWKMGEEIIKIPFINNSGKYVGVGEKVQIIHNDDSEVILMVL